MKFLRILEVASGLPKWGGTEIHLINLSEQLTARGHVVTVLCQPNSFVEKEAHLRNLPTVPGICRHQTDFGNALPLYRAIRSGHYDVVHVHWSPDYILPPLMARLSRVPVVLMSHHSPHPMKRGAWKRFLFRRVLFNRIIALSESVRQTLIAHTLLPERVVTIHHGTNTEAFRQVTKSAAEMRTEWGIPPEAFVVGIAGRVADEKGIDDFLQAIASLRSRQIYGVIIGDGPALDTLKTLTTTLKLDDRVVFAGFRSDINNAINALNVLVLASTWAEPCAAVIQQAMALNKPVVGTNIGGTPEMIVHEETGILVTPHCPGEIAAALERLASAPTLQAQMGERGRQRVEAHFTLHGMTDKIEALYRQEYEAKQARGRK